jgi:hypothetical protein
MLCVIVKSHAQFLDSLNHTFRSKPGIDARLESRFSFFKNEVLTVSGVRLGVAYKRKLRMGGGVSWASNNYSETFYEHNALKKQHDTVLKYLKLGYMCYYIDFVFHRTKRWQLSVPIQAGAGFVWWQKESVYKWNTGDKKYFLLLYEPGITVQYKIFRWLGAGTDVGYRFVLKNNKKIGERLLSPTFSFKALFWPDQLFYQLWPEHKISKKFGPAEW